jgi:hypothetical protein
LGKIAEIEKISVEPEEIEAEIADIAAYHRVTPEDVKKSLGSQDGLRQIEHNLKTRKAIEALVGKIKVTEGEWREEPQPEAAANVSEGGEPPSESAEQAAEQKGVKPKRSAKKKSEAKTSAKAKSADE